MVIWSLVISLTSCTSIQFDESKFGFIELTAETKNIPVIQTILWGRIPGLDLLKMFILSFGKRLRKLSHVSYFENESHQLSQRRKKMSKEEIF